MKIVIISQTVFPSQYPRSLRSTELAIEFSRQKHDTVLYGVLGNYDYSKFEKENSNLKVRNIGKMMFSKLNSSEEQQLTFFDRVMKKFFNYLLEFPDIEFVYRIFQILKYENNIDLLITVGMPFPIHWGAAFSKSIYKDKFPVVWIADCGDPYMGNPLLKRPFYFKYVEKWFLGSADFISVPIENAKYAYYSDYRDKIRVIPQGFRIESSSEQVKEPDNTIPTFIYAGTFYKNHRDPTFFLEFLSTIQEDFRFEVFTKTPELISPFLKKLQGRLIVNKYIERSDLIKKMKSADFLINFENKSAVQSPSKLIDYALSGRPVFHVVNGKNDFIKFKFYLKKQYERNLFSENIDEFRIENITNKFIDLYKQKLIHNYIK